MAFFTHTHTKNSIHSFQSGDCLRVDSQRATMIYVHLHDICVFFELMIESNWKVILVIMCSIFLGLSKDPIVSPLVFGSFFSNADHSQRMPSMCSCVQLKCFCLRARSPTRSMKWKLDELEHGSISISKLFTENYFVVRRLCVSDFSRHFLGENMKSPKSECGEMTLENGFAIILNAMKNYRDESYSCFHCPANTFAKNDELTSCISRPFIVKVSNWLFR